MALAWAAGLDLATRNDNLEPMSPLSCLGVLSAAVGVFALGTLDHRTSMGAGLVTFLTGAAGLADTAFNGGRTINSALFGIDARTGRP